MNKKRLFSLILLLLISISEIIAQTTIIIPSANNAGTGASATIRRKPLGSNRSFERTAIKYSKDEVGLLGNITGIAFYCDSVLNAGKTPIKIYIKEVADSTFSAGTTVIAEETNATLVFADTLFSSAFIKNTWVPITFSTPFLHANQSAIELIIETNSGGLNGSDLTALAKGFRYSAKTGTINSMQYWQSAANSSTIPAGNGTLSTNRPNVQLTIASAPGCVAPPNAGMALPSFPATCPNVSFNLYLSGASTGLGLSYQWLSSLNNITWDTIVGAIQPTINTTQIVTKYYSCIVMCNNQKDTSTSIAVAMNPFYLCYCNSNLGGGCAGGQGTAIDSVSFTGTTLAKGNSGCSPNNYVAYSASGNTTAILTQGESYTLSNKFTGNVKASVWIDYNANGIFENSEWKQICLTSATGTVFNTTINIPSNATAGIVGMRIRSRTSNSTNDSTSACTNFTNSGETEDYLISILAAAACVSPPAAGVLAATDTLTCNGSLVAFSITGNSSGAGQSYEWLSSTTGVNYITIAGAAEKFYSAIINAEGFYKCKITCNGLSSTTNVIQVKLKQYYDCYCVTGIGGNCNQQATAIDSVAIEGTTLSIGGTACGLNYYTLFPDSGNTTANLIQGESYVLKTKYTGAVKSSIWIDYNHNGKFDNSEWQQITTASIANVVQSVGLIIPLNALAGKAGMRIRSRSTAGVNDSTSACANFGTGETEDFVITILASLPCIQPPNAGITLSSKSSVCAGGSVSLNLNGNTFGLGQSYQWLKSFDGKIWTVINGRTKNFLNDTVFQKTYFACELNCSGFKDTSIHTIVETNPFYNCYCVTNIGGNCVTSSTAIDSVAIASTSLANASMGCAVNYYTAYPSIGNTTGTILKGVQFGLETITSGVANLSVWIDFDHSGTFDSTEYVASIDSTIAGVAMTRIIVVRSDSKLGKTGMRIRTRSIAGVNGSNNACTTFGSGETEDYVINIDTVFVQSVPLQFADNYIKVYPNPTSNEFKIVQLLEKHGTILIYDLQGRLMLKEKLNEYTNSISLQNLSNGIYIYRYLNIQNEQVANGKITVIK